MDNQQLTLARRLMEETGVNLFLTGKAGTGKTTFLRDFREHTDKRVVVVAPTGIAAINAGGVTIHSFFQLSFSPFIPGVQMPGERRYDRFSREKLKVIRSMDVLVIDEMSMVRADLLDAIDASLRRHRDPTRPFGGVQLLMIGDLQQLAPVVRDDEAELLRRYYPTNYFFDSHALREAGYETVELDKVYRQNDREFLDILNRIRTNTADASVLEAINRRCRPGFAPDPGEGYIRLTTHNRLANAVNEAELERVAAPAFTFEARVDGDFPEQSYPAEHLLVLKEGAQVMFIKNDSSGAHRYYNGMIGHITSITSAGVQVRPAGGGELIDVEPEEWENNRYTIDPESREIREEVTGTFSQYPLRLAWSITIHKSQGLTFEHAIIDASQSFAHGQTYVALSRCRTLDGLVLERPLSPSAIITDSSVSQFVSAHTSAGVSDERMEELRRHYTLSLLSDLFGMRKMRMTTDLVLRILEESMSSTFPALVGEWRQLSRRLHSDGEDVAARFLAQCHSIISSGAEGSDLFLNSRISAGAGYFGRLTESVAELLRRTPDKVDNRETTSRLRQRRDELREQLDIKRRLYELFSVTPFSASLFLKTKARAVVDGGSAPGSRQASRNTTSRTSRRTVQEEDIIPEEVKNTDLYMELLTWRKKKAAELSTTTARVCPSSALVRLANNPVATLRQLALMRGFGGKKIDMYGEELVGITRRHVPQGTPSAPDDTDCAPDMNKPSWQISADLFRQGYNAVSIAEQRCLAPTTIHGHLATAITAGMLDAVTLVGDTEALHEIYGALECSEKEERSLTRIFEKLGGKYTMEKIRYVRAFFELMEGKEAEA